MVQLAGMPLSSSSSSSSLFRSLLNHDSSRSPRAHPHIPSAASRQLWAG